MDTIVHPNTYFRRSYMLKHGAKNEEAKGDEMEM
jgi:hypothetical protein